MQKSTTAAAAGAASSSLLLGELVPVRVWLHVLMRSAFQYLFQ